MCLFEKRGRIAVSPGGEKKKQGNKSEPPTPQNSTGNGWQRAKPSLGTEKYRRREEKPRIGARRSAKKGREREGIVSLISARKKKITRFLNRKEKRT